MNDLFTVNHLQLDIDGKRILDDVSFSMKAGEKVAVIGANGSGKSSLISVLTGFLFPSSGTVLCEGKPIPPVSTPGELRAYRTKIGHMHQGLNLVERLSVLENVLVGRLGKNSSSATWFRKFRAEDHDVAIRALEQVNLAHKARQRTSTLSGGERQRVAIARVLAQETKILFADEPTSALDPFARQETADLLGQLSADLNLTLFVAIHDVDLLPKLCDRVLGMKHGKIVIDQNLASLETQKLKGIYGRSEEQYDQG